MTETHPETELFFVSRFVWPHRQADVASHETKGYLCYINGVLTDNKPPGLSRTGFLSRRGRWRSRETSNGFPYAGLCARDAKSRTLVLVRSRVP